MIFGRPVRRAILNATSLASAPELQNSTRPDPVAPSRSSSISASEMAGSVRKKFETCPRVLICSVTARITAG
jgi:hypothetical protein